MAEPSGHTSGGSCRALEHKDPQFARSAMPGAGSTWLKSQDNNTKHRDKYNCNIRDFIMEIEEGTKSEIRITATCQCLENETGAQNKREEEMVFHHSCAQGQADLGTSVM